MKFHSNKNSKGQTSSGKANGTKKGQQKVSQNSSSLKSFISKVKSQKSSQAFQGSQKNHKRSVKSELRRGEKEENQKRYEEEEENLDAYVKIGVQKNQIRGKNQENSQYNELLQSSTKGFKRHKNMYFLQNEKYRGRIIEKDEQDQSQVDEQEFQDNDDDDIEPEYGMEEDQIQGESNENDIEPEQDEEAENNEIHKALSLLKQKRNSTSKLINSQLQQINAEDGANIKATIKSKSKTTDQELAQALQLKRVLEIYDKFVALRYGQQKELQEMKKYPIMDEESDLPKYPPISHQLFTSSRELQNQMVSNLSQYLQIFKRLAKKTICRKNKNQNIQKDSENEQNDDKNQHQEQTEDINLEELIQAQEASNDLEDSESPGRLNVDKLYTFIKENISSQTVQVQKELIKWSQKTSFLTPTTSTKLNSLLMQTPVGQAKKVMQNWERLASKCQQKRGREMFKILFEPEENIHELSHPQIYDDYDLFIELQKYYLERVEDEKQDEDFLQSATMKYLKNKQINQLEHEKKQKDVDRKASKNRKIRYNIHTKLLNFMPSVPENVIETRDEIVRNIFNCNARINEESIEGNAAKYRMTQHHDETELIDVE